MIHVYHELVYVSNLLPGSTRQGIEPLFRALLFAWHESVGRLKRNCCVIHRSWMLSFSVYVMALSWTQGLPGRQPGSRGSISGKPSERWEATLTADLRAL